MLYNVIMTLRPTSTPQYEQPGVMLSDLSRVSKETEAHESAGVHHEHEFLNEFSQPNYEEVKLPKAQPAKQEQLQWSMPVSDYELTQCQAYAPVAGVRGDTSK